MLRAAAMKVEKDVHLSVCGFKSDFDNKTDTFEVVEEILFRVCEIRVWERACESVEVEGRIHLSQGRQSWSKWKSGVGPFNPIGKNAMFSFLINKICSKSHLSPHVHHSPSDCSRSVK